MSRKAWLTPAVALARALSARSQASLVTFEGLAYGQIVRSNYQSLQPRDRVRR
ncbi:MAG: hypothetical protein ACUVTZ_00375 [Armatimonadota bacterium]